MAAPTLDYQSRGGVAGHGLAPRPEPPAGLALALRNAALTVGFALVAISMLMMGTGALWALGPARVFGPMPALLALLSVALILRSVRRRRGAAVLGYLGQAVRVNQPLPGMLEAAAQGEGGKLARRLRALADAVGAGAHVGPSVEELVPEVDRRDARLLAQAEAAGDLAGALRHLLEEQRKQRPKDGSHWVMTRAYPIWLLGLFGGVVGMLLVFVVPKFERILKDFRMPVPASLEALRWLGLWVVPWLSVLLGLVTIWYLSMMVWEMFLPWDRRSVLRGLWDRLAWFTPVVGDLARTRGLSDALAVTHAGVRAGMPLGTALGHAAELRLNAVLTGRVRKWQAGTESGLPPAEAAAAAGMPALVAGMLRTAGPRLDDALTFLRLHYAARFSRLATLLEAAVIPVSVLMVGALTLVVALSIFQPMIELTTKLAAEVKVTP